MSKIKYYPFIISQDNTPMLFFCLLLFLRSILYQFQILILFATPNQANSMQFPENFWTSDKNLNGLKMLDVSTYQLVLVVSFALSAHFLVAQWLQRLTGVQKIAGSIRV